jgi:hypothetical protein
MANNQLENSLLKLVLESDKPISDPLKQFIVKFSKIHTGKVTIDKDSWRNAGHNEIVDLRLVVPFSKTVKDIKQNYTFTFTISYSANLATLEYIQIAAKRVTMKNERSYHNSDPWFYTYNNRVDIKFTSGHFDQVTDVSFQNYIRGVFANAIHAYEKADKNRIAQEKREKRMAEKRERIKQKLFTEYGLKDNKIANEAFDAAFEMTDHYDPSLADISREFKFLAKFLKADPNADDPIEQLTESK